MLRLKRVLAGVLLIFIGIQCVFPAVNAKADYSETDPNAEIIDQRAKDIRDSAARIFCAPLQKGAKTDSDYYAIWLRINGESVEMYEGRVDGDKSFVSNPSVGSVTSMYKITEDFKFGCMNTFYYSKNDYVKYAYGSSKHHGNDCYETYKGDNTYHAYDLYNYEEIKKAIEDVCHLMLKHADSNDDTDNIVEGSGDVPESVVKLNTEQVEKYRYILEILLSLLYDTTTGRLKNKCDVSYDRNMVLNYYDIIKTQIPEEHNVGRVVPKVIVKTDIQGNVYIEHRGKDELLDSTQMPNLTSVVKSVIAYYSDTDLKSAACRYYPDGKTPGDSFTLLVEQVKTLRDAVKSAEDEKAKDEANKEIDKAVKEFASLSSDYERWKVIILNHAKTGDDTLDELTDAFKVYYNYSSAKDNIKHQTTLSNEQKVRLFVYDVLVHKYNSFNSNVSSSILSDSDSAGTQLQNAFGELELKDKNAVGLSAETIRNAAESANDRTAGKFTSSATATNIMLNYADIVRIRAAQLYGFRDEDPFSLGNDSLENSETFSANAFLRSIMPSISEAIVGDDVTYFPEKFPGDMRLMNTTLNSPDDYVAYVELQYLLLFADAYARTWSMSGLSKDADNNDKLVNSDMDIYLQEYEENRVTAVASTQLIRQITSYKEIAEALTFLGVDPWTDELKTVVNYYTRLQGIGAIDELRKTYTVDTTSPMSAFFNIDSKEFSYYYNLGVALSASYIPMQTNMYDISSLQALEDATFVERFHYPFGFYRKALYIDTDVNSAVNKYVSGKVGSLKVATLEDLLSCEKDISLYLDNSFYNVDKLADKWGMEYKKLTNDENAEEISEDSLLEQMADGFLSWFGIKEVSMEEVAKTAGYSTYAARILNEISEYQGEESDEEETGTEYVMSSKMIRKYLRGWSDKTGESICNEYTPMQSFAVVSAIYRDKRLYNQISKAISNQKPVFISSPNLAAMEGVSRKEWNTIYNYIMLKNLKGNMGLDYETTLDLKSPIYMDVYGNILTESGFVVIPAASNPTIQTANGYNIYTAGYLSLSDNGYELPLEYNNADKYAGGINKQTGTVSGMFEKNEEEGVWRVRNKIVNKLYINFRDLPVSNMDVLKTLITINTQNLANNHTFDFSDRAYLITEVMRGAPIEHINKQFEGLNLGGTVNKAGIYAAYKLEELSDVMFSSSNGNSIVSLPNLAFIEGYEVIMMFVYKLAVALLVALLFILVYMDVVKGRIGLKTIGKFIVTVVLFVIVVYIVPNVMNFSYYASNRALLQDETEYIAMLNLEKHNEGKEIGVADVSEIRSNTELYIKLEDVTVPWYEAASSILSANTFETMQEIYDNSLSEHLMSKLDGVITKSNALYMDINTIFDSTKIEYDSKTQGLYNSAVSPAYASYVMPYYAILDTLVLRVNEYNKNNSSLAFTTTVQSKGNVRTKGLIAAYFKSNDFMVKSQDVTGLKTVYGLDTTLYEISRFTQSDIEAMQRSLWFIDFGEVSNRDRLDELNQAARQFVVSNRGLIGRVSDETFLKMMALSLALEHNRIFKVPAANSIEIFNLDTQDIMRLAIADKATTMDGAAKSFARFVYDEAGMLGVIGAACLTLVYWVVSIVKPVLVLVILAVLIVALVIRRLFKRDKDKAIEGFVISLMLLCGVNMLFALCLKASMYLPKMGLNPVIAIMAQVFIQLLYVGLLFLLFKVVAKDWESLGFNVYSQKVRSLRATSVQFVNQHTPLRVKTLPSDVSDAVEHNRRGLSFSRRKKTKDLRGQDIYNMMRDRDSIRSRRRSRRSRNNEE